MGLVEMEKAFRSAAGPESDLIGMAERGTAYRG